MLKRTRQTPAATPRRWDNPEIGQEIAPRLKIFHDCAEGEFAAVIEDAALRLTCYQFAGGYLSLALALAAKARAGLRPGRQVVLSFTASCSRPLPAFVRLNVQFDPQKEVLHDSMILADGARRAAFDLGGLNHDLGGITDVWCDLILSQPEMSETVLTDLKLEVAQNAG